MYAAKMCHNSVLGDRILFILGWSHFRQRATIWVQTACNGAKNSWLYDECDHVL